MAKSAYREQAEDEFAAAVNAIRVKLPREDWPLLGRIELLHAMSIDYGRTILLKRLWGRLWSP